MLAHSHGRICDNASWTLSNGRKFPMKSSSQPVWLITGAAGALGQAMVEHLMAGANECIALDRDQRALNALHDRLLDETGRAPVLLPLDLVGAGPDDYDELAASIESDFGRLDRLVHNAAMFTALRPIEHQLPEEWMKVMQTGLTGPWLLTRAMLPLMRKSNGAKVVFVSDRHCLEKPANWGAYGLSQAGREWLARALAAELGPRGPQVVDVDPGPFYSRLRAAAWPVATPDELPSPQTAARKLLEQIDKGVH
jgi:NAD(P)-dependent dehydrogenase (short-subunit alcohol dehydrogenase family)